MLVITVVMLLWQNLHTQTHTHTHTHTLPWQMAATAFAFGDVPREEVHVRQASGGQSSNLLVY